MYWILWDSHIILSSIFWLFLAVIFYAYVGYGIILFCLNKIGLGYEKNIVGGQLEDWPEVSLVIAAYNEESCIRAKIENSLELDYPSSKVHIFVVSDGSNDKTNSIVSAFQSVNLLYKSERKGKIAAMHRVMGYVKTPITIFTDANTILSKNSIKSIVEAFIDPSVGAVAGEKRVCSDTNGKTSEKGESLYWRYESFLKRLDARFYSAVGAAGELFAIRTDLYSPVSQDTILDDFLLTMNINAMGFRTAYTPEAYAYETASASHEDEFERKARIAAGGFQAVSRLASRISLINNTRLAFQYYSHRVLRWCVTPFSLIIILASNVMLALTGSVFFQVTIMLQVVFYIMAILGYQKRNQPPGIRGIMIPYYFVFMHIAVLAGFLRFLQRKQDVRWEKVRRMNRVLKAG
jgi:cellulose synthase/poly-beta-1,6-N-acetylglucosamine synthase-like glycosyltransferase